MRYVLISVIVLAVSCSPEKGQLEPVDNDPRDSATINMAHDLENWYGKLTADKSNYKNEERSELFRQLAGQKQGVESLTYLLRAEYQLLLAGQTRRAIKGFNRVDSIARAMGIPPDQNVYRLTEGCRAVASLRLGEQENCQLNHSMESCILPFAEQSFHELPEGSQGAIDEIEKILSHSDDLNYQYVLNIAYATLGRYPDDVPDKWRMPLVPGEEAGLLDQKFKNISSLIGVDDDRLSGGVVIEDFDNDMDLDIMTSSWKLMDQVYYYENDGQGNFTNKFREAGLEGIGGGLNMSHGDYNNDGFMDVFITRGAWLPYGTFPNSLLRNNGDGTFTDVTRETGLYSLHPTQASAWLDVNNDGWLDLFVGNESIGEFTNKCELWLNDGTGHFTDIAADVNAAVIGFIKGVAPSDYDNDGDIDLYLSNMLGDNFLLNNQPADNEHGFTFYNVTARAGVAKPDQAFPCWFFDINNDGWDDIFVSAFPYTSYGQFAAEWAKEMMGQKNEVEKPKIYINNRDGSFADKTIEYGLETTCYAMGSGFGDLNNDGYLDFYLGTGEPDFKALVPNRMFLNRDGKRFSEVTSQGGFGHVQKGHAISFADLNNDGYEDIYAVMGGAYEGDGFYNALFANPGNENQWIKLELEGTESNKGAYGARIELVLDQGGSTRSIYRTVSSGPSFGENPRWSHIGFPVGAKIQAVRIQWPSGKRQQLANLEPGYMYHIIEGSNAPEKIKLKAYAFDLNQVHGQHGH